MRGALMALVLAAGALLIACGGEATDLQLAATRTATPAATAAALTGRATIGTPATGGAVTGAETNEASRFLLTLLDLPAGWTVGGRAVAPAQEEVTRLCNVSHTYRIQARATIKFNKSQQDPVIDNATAVFAPGDAQRALDDARTVLQSCSIWTEPAPNGKTRIYRIEPLRAFPDLGEQTVAFKMDIESEGPPTQVAVVQIRRGDATSTVVYTVPPSAVPDAALLEQIARRADERLANRQ